MLLLIDDAEELEFELIDQTGDGVPGKFIYKRLDDGKLRELRARHVGSAPEASWTEAQRAAMDSECIQLGWIRGEGWVIRRAGGTLEPVSPTVAQVLKMPEWVRVAIAQAIRGETHPKKRGAPLRFTREEASRIAERLNSKLDPVLSGLARAILDTVPADPVAPKADHLGNSAAT